MKGKDVAVQIMKPYAGERIQNLPLKTIPLARVNQESGSVLSETTCISPVIPNLGIRWKTTICFTPPPLYSLGKSPPPGTHCVGGWSEWDPDWSRRMENEIIACLCQEPNTRFFPSLVTILTTLSQLSSQHHANRVKLFHPY
jgi:hypothetical protein